MLFPETDVPGTIKVESGLLDYSHLFIADAEVIPCISIVGHLVSHHLEGLDGRIQVFVIQGLYPDHFECCTQIEKKFRVIRCKLNSPR